MTQMPMGTTVPPGELATVLAFCAVMGLVFYLEGRWLLRFLVYPNQRPRSTPSVLWLHATAGFGVCCILYGKFIEPSWIDVQFVEMRSEKMTEGRIRLVQLADTHSEATVGNERRAVEIVNGLKPDMVLLTGDYLNKENALPVFKEMLSGLRASSGIYLVKGNHDLEMGVLDAALKDGAAVLLPNTAKDLTVNKVPIRLIGMESGDGGLLKRLARPALKTKLKSLTIFISHFSDLIYSADEAGVDLYLAAHTHGGQIRMPLYGALLTMSRMGKRFEAGRYLVGRTTLYVNRGLGMSAPRFRFLCRPEITVLDILPPLK